MKRGMLISIIAAAVLFVAGSVMLALWPEGEAETEAEPGPSIEPRSTGDLIRVSHVDVDNVEMMPRDRTYYTLRLDHSHPEYWDIELIAEDALFPGMQLVMYTIFSHATSMARLVMVTEDADDGQLALYGLDAPILQWRVNLLDGTKMEFELGLRLATGSGNYVRLADSRDVYILDDAAVSFLTMDIKDIYDIFFFPYPPSGAEYETWDLIEHLLLERPGDETIELSRRDDEEWFASPYGISRYRLLQPFEGEGGDSVVKSIVLEPITNIIPESIIAISPPDVSAYGLDLPVRLTISTSGWEGTLLIGRHDPELRGRYLMIEGHDAILFDPHGDYGFLDLDPAQLRTQMTWVHHIDTVSSIVFELDGATRTLEIEHPAAGSDESLTGWLDGREIGEANTRRLYAAVMSIPVSGGTDEQVPDEPPVYRMTMHFQSGGSQALGLYHINESHYLMVLGNENLNVYTTRLQIQLNLLSRIELLDAGEDLPR
jgi:hypothetical protein